jgi:hypothetical protein
MKSPVARSPEVTQRVGFGRRYFMVSIWKMNVPTPCSIALLL